MTPNYTSAPSYVAADEVATGSLESQARGQAARKNAGKPQWWLLPLWVLDGAALRLNLRPLARRVFGRSAADTVPGYIHLFIRLAAWRACPPLALRPRHVHRLDGDI
jgi:hypothetical protein